MKKESGLILVLALALALTLAGGVWAQTGKGYDLTWWTVDGGGGALSGGGYDLAGTIGQADAGPALSSGSYALSGGFWMGDAPAPAFRTYLPGVRRGSP